jgi:hypothetical protein
MLFLLCLAAQDAVTGDLVRVEKRVVVVAVARDEGRRQELGYRLAEGASVPEIPAGRRVVVTLREGLAVRVEPAEAAVLKGEVVRADRRTLVLAIPKDGGRREERELRLGEGVGELVPGRKVAVTLRDGVAVRVEATESQTLTGDVVRADGRSITILAGREEVRLKLDEEARRVEPGRRVTVTHRDGVALRVEVVEPPKPPAPAPLYPVNEKIVPAGTKAPDVGGRVTSAFDDGGTWLVTLRHRAGETAVVLPKEAVVTYVGLEREFRRPTVGHVGYVWLKAGSSDTAAEARFGPER